MSMIPLNKLFSNLFVTLQNSKLVAVAFFPYSSSGSLKGGSKFKRIHASALSQWIFKFLRTIMLLTSFL